jgi:hypothetical protein
MGIKRGVKVMREKDKDHEEVGADARWEDSPTLNLIEVTRLHKDCFPTLTCISTYFICFTIVLFPDSPAPETRRH